MKRRIFLILAFVCVQLFAYTSFCVQKYDNSFALSAKNYKICIDNPLSGFINQSQNDARLICQSVTQKMLNYQYKKCGTLPYFAFSPDFKSSQKDALLKFLNDKSRLKNKHNLIAFGTEVSRRAP